MQNLMLKIKGALGS